MSYKRLFLIVTIALVFGGSIVLSVLQLVEPPPAPAEVVAGPALHARLTKRLLLVIVDGLRYDVATDPLRMPLFAAAMQAHTSGESWAGRVSMTTSGVLSLGTGQRGRLEQVIRNLSAKPPSHNSWLANARDAGVRVAVAGDNSWYQLYGSGLAAKHLDPEGVAIDADFNAQTFAGTRDLLAGNYDAVIAHFVTPDHQGHAYGIQSARYAKHIYGFDADLARLLRELDPSWTVVVTSDHGAADSGTHGADVPVQRRSPVYAYGPGISPNIRQHESIDQLDLSATLPLLLGVTPPAHGTGTVLAEWLDLPANEAASVACENATRVLAYASHVASSKAMQPATQAFENCAAVETAATQMQAATRAVRAADVAVTDATGLASPAAGYWLTWLTFLALLTSIAVFGRDCSVRALVAGALVLVVTVVLVQQVERLPGTWPNVVRGTLLALGNAVFLALALFPTKVLAYFQSLRPYMPALLPGVLVAGYPPNIAPEAYVATVIVSLVLLAGVWSERSSSGFWRGFWARVRVPRFVAWAGGLLVLVRVAYVQNATYSGFSHSDLVKRLVATALLALGAYALQSALAASLAGLGLLWALALAPVWLRPVLGPLLGRSAWLGMAALFVLQLARGGNRARALWFGLCSCMWLARDFESWPLIAAFVVSWLIGDSVASVEENAAPREGLLLLATLGFSLIFALRVGLQDGLEFGGIDFGAGVFHDPHVSAKLIGLALVYKYAVATLVISLALSHGLPAARSLMLAKALLAAFLLRTFALTCTLFIAGSSYWTAMRVIGDMPSMLTVTLGALIFLVWCARTRGADAALA